MIVRVEQEVVCAGLTIDGRKVGSGLIDVQPSLTCITCRGRSIDQLTVLVPVDVVDIAFHVARLTDAAVTACQWHEVGSVRTLLTRKLGVGEVLRGGTVADGVDCRVNAKKQQGEQHPYLQILNHVQYD